MLHPFEWQVYKTEELQMIADLCIKHDVLCISDEVYEWLTYGGAKHVKIGESTQEYLCFIYLYSFINAGNDSLTASLPGMWERTITVGSGGKTFSATGWKVLFRLRILKCCSLRYIFMVQHYFLLRLAGPSALGIS